MISVNFILKQLFDTLGIEYKCIPLTKSKKTLNYYSQWRAQRRILIRVSGGVERNCFPYCCSNLVTNGQKSIIVSSRIINLFQRVPFIKGPTWEHSFEMG